MKGIKHLAQRLDISIGTVSRALNGKPDVNPETRRRVLEAAEELTGVRGEGLEEPPLPLAEERVEGERRLARSRDAGHRHERVSRKRYVDSGQVVLAGPSDVDASVPSALGHPACPAWFPGTRTPRSREGCGGLPRTRDGVLRASQGSRAVAA